ncbi:MAG: hypothetical protein ACM3L5_00195 [Candidatus Saccharibacteria bacterium]
MKKIAIVAVAIALIIVGAGAYAALTLGNSTKANLLPDNGGNNDNNIDNQTGNATKNTTLDIHFPVNLSADQAKIMLNVTYPGEHAESSFIYNWTQPYQFSISSSVVGSYEGRVLNKIFALKSGEIGAKCLIVQSSNRTVNWTLDELQGINHISGDLNTWTSNGSTGNDHPFTVIFNRTGDFELMFQSFDLDTGKALSVPYRTNFLKVPVVGTLGIKTLGPGSYVSDENGTRFGVLLNITNQWNIRYDVSAANLFISNGTANVTANLTAMAFEKQSLAVGQSTQFMAYFDITGPVNKLSLFYNDPISDQIITVPLG